MTGFRREKVAWILVVIFLTTSAIFGAKDVQFQKSLAQINQDINYVINNVSFKIAPRDIKERLENIRKISSTVVFEKPVVEKKKEATEEKPAAK
ncbi:MAG: hypothetical protein WBD24_03700 [Candidatus Omnitrophota bacterium]